MRQLRGWTAGLCGALCVLGLVSAVVNTYLLRTLFDADRFSRLVAASLDEEPVAGVVADQIADQILRAERDLTAFRPVLLGAIEYVVSSVPFRAMVRRAARPAHEALLSGDGGNFALNIADFGVIARGALSAWPELSARVPASTAVAIDVIGDWPAAEYLARAVSIGERMRTRALLSLGLVLLAGLAGLMAARRRDRFLLRTGLALTILGLLLAACFEFGAEPVARFARTAAGADLVRGLWHVFLGPLAIRMLVLATLGLVLVAAVTSVLERISVAALVRGLGKWGGSRPARARWAFLRGAVLAAAGLVALFQPTATVVVLTAIAGAALLFAGIQELFTAVLRVVRRFMPDATPRAPEVARARGRLVVGLVVGVLVAAGAWWLARPQRDNALANADPVSCNGYPELCDRRLDEVVFAATHNAMADADNPDWMLPNQDHGLRVQLEDGVRGLLLDIHYGIPVGERIKTDFADEAGAMAKYEQVLGQESVQAAVRIRDRMVGADEGEREIYSCHGFCELGALRFSALLAEIRQFLVANPGEVLILVIQDEGVTAADVANCFAESGLLQFVYRGPVRPPWPTLREMIDRDERVLVVAENDAAGVPWYHPAFEVFQETPYRFHDPSEFSNAVGRGGTGGSLLLLNHWIETTPAPLPSNAQVANSWELLHQRAQDCRQERGMLPNLVAVDFYATGDLLRVVRALNGVENPAR